MDRHLVNSLQPVARRTRCTYLDSCLKHGWPTIVLGYPERLDPSRLRHALARVLSDFSSFAGRLRYSRGDWYIEHGVGALFESAESNERNETIEAALRTGDTKLVCPRLPVTGTLRGKGPLFAARLTQTRNGSVLGVTWNHALCDNHSVMLLLRAWVLACHEQPYKKPLEVADRETYLNEHVIRQDGSGTKWRVVSWSEFRHFLLQQVRLMRNAKRVAIDFSWSQIAAIHAAATGDRSVSPNDSLCAYIFWTLNALSKNVSSHYAVAYDYRKTFGLPSGLLGNLSDFVTVTAKPGAGPGAIAESLRAGIDAFDAGSLTQRKLQTLKSAHPSILDEMRFWGPGEPGRINLRLTNVSRAGHYKLVFASARPTFVHTRATDIPVVGVGTIFASSREAGLTMDIVLPSHMIKQLARERTWALTAPSRLAFAEA
jgi:hypothetical protein